MIIASITDIRTGKIYNKLTLPAVLVGLALRSAQFAVLAPDAKVAAGIAGLVQAIMGCFLGLLSLGVFKMTIMRKLGGGDVKLMAALGAFVGPGMILAIFIYYCLFFGLYTCTVMALAYPWGPALLALRTHTQQAINFERFNAVRKRPLPVAPFIAAGLLVEIVFYQQTSVFFGFK